MRVYLDNCMFNRPFDDQQQLRIQLESQAKLHIQEQIIQGNLQLIWSYILEYENSKNPHDERRNAIQKWKSIATYHVLENPSILSTANQLLQYGIKPKDALHVASAVDAQAGVFLTTDDRLISCVTKSDIIKVLTPIEYLKVLEK